MPSATSTEQDLAHALLRLMPEIGHVAQSIAREHGTVSPDRGKVLRALANGPRRSGELAQVCWLTRPSLTEIVETLVQEDLVRRDEDATDRRVVLLSLTPAGRRAIQRFDSAFAAAIERVVSRLDAPGRERLRASLADLHRAFTEVRDGR